MKLRAIHRSIGVTEQRSSLCRWNPLLGARNAGSARREPVKRRCGWHYSCENRETRHVNSRFSSRRNRESPWHHSAFCALTLIPTEVQSLRPCRRNSCLTVHRLKRVVLSTPSRAAFRHFAGASGGLLHRVVWRSSIAACCHGMVWTGERRAVPLRILRLRVCFGNRMLDALLLPFRAREAHVGDRAWRSAPGGCFVQHRSVDRRRERGQIRVSPLRFVRRARQGAAPPRYCDAARGRSPLLV